MSMFGKKIDAKKIRVANVKVTFEYTITDKKQAELAAGKKALRRGSLSDWDVTSLGGKVKLTYKAMGPISIGDVAKKFEEMVT